MARPRPSSPPPAAAPSFEPDEPVFRVVNRVKGAGRRRLVFGLALAGTPLEALPAILVRENLTACEYEALHSAFAPELDGELLPDLFAGELEAARVTWHLPDDGRTISLRLRPLAGAGAWRLVDDRYGAWELPRPFIPAPPTIRDVVSLLDEARSGSLPRGGGVLRSAWEEARRLGWEGEKARRAVDASAVLLGTEFHYGVVGLVDALFEAFDGGRRREAFDADGAALEEVVH